MCMCVVRVQVLCACKYWVCVLLSVYNTQVISLQCMKTWNSVAFMLSLSNVLRVGYHLPKEKSKLLF